jgi:hypothetical protein
LLPQLATVNCSAGKLGGYDAMVSDPLTRAALYRERAQECFELAAIASDDQIRVHFKQLAENYLTLANAELRFAGHSSPVRDHYGPQPTKHPAPQ